MLFAATIRERVEDFDVTEELGFEFSGDGEHDYLYLQKTGTNTEWLARQLAGFAKVPAKDIGYSGLKDRHAVTRQWFSVPRWNTPEWADFSVEGVSILQRERHLKKLRRGAHKANLFSIVLRGEDLPQHAAALEARLAMIQAEGVPNYFGEQRFGRGGANLALADQWAEGRRLPRHKRSLAISTVRSFVFNENLQGRVQDGSWNQILPGDLVNLDGSNSVFTVPEVDADIQRRLVEMDIHPASELSGDGSNCGYDTWQQALDKGRVQTGSRSLRLPVRNLHVDTEGESVRLSFRLGRGAYATSVLREIANISNAAR
jgi:tRNA pseudouridine13 synthase